MRSQLSDEVFSHEIKITQHARSRIWPISAKMCFGFYVGKYLFCPEMFNFVWKCLILSGNPCNFQGFVNNASGTLSQKLTLSHSYIPKYWPKMWHGWWKKLSTLFCQILSKNQVYLWSKYSEPKEDYKTLFSSRSYKSLKFQFVCSPISPSQFWSCWRGFHEFVKSRGLSTSELLTK